MIEKDISYELTANANLRSGEFAWSLIDFPSVVLKARALEVACVGGQFQFRLPDAICEVYWLDADSAPRNPDEHWCDYAKRSCDEVLEKFNALMSRVDLREEAMRWKDVAELAGPEAVPEQYACFVAYFKTASADI